MPNKLKGIDPNQLMLWKRVITTKESKNLKLSELEDDDQLDATWKIGKYFTGDPPNERIHIVVVPPGSETRVSFSNYAYLLTVLSSLKPLPPVSETRVSFANYAYLLTVLSSLKLPLLVSETRFSFSN